MHFLQKILGTLTVAVLSLVATAFILDTTILSAKYTNQVAKSSGFYDGLAPAMPDLLLGGVPEGQKSDAKTILSSVITPRYVQGKWEGISVGWEKHYRTRSPLPKLDFSDIDSKATEQGFNFPPELKENFSRPPALEEIAFLAFLYQAVGWLKIFGTALGALLLVLAWLVASGHHFKALAKVFLGSAIGLSTTFLLFLAAPGIVSGALSSNKDLKTLTPAITKFLQAIFSGVNQQLGVVIVGFAAAAAVCFILGMVARMFGGHRMGNGRGVNRPIERFKPPEK